MSPGDHMKLAVEWERRDCGHDTPCLISLYQPNSTGYCRITVDGKRDYAHRHAYRAAHGEIPRGAVVDHLCHGRGCTDEAVCIHRRCSEPTHLALTDHTENIRRGRNVRLTHAAVAGLRLIVGAHSGTDRIYAVHYGIGEHAIYMARTGRSWR